MTSGISSFGTLLKQGDGGATESFTTIAEVRDISGPGLTLETEDATTHGSTNGWREFIATLFDAGEVTFEIQYVPTGATHDATTGLIADMEARTLRNFQLVFPDTGATQWDFSAYVTGFEPAAPVAGILMASLTLRISGEPTLA